MRRVSTRSPSFPEAPTETPLSAPAGRWNVLCGDQGHWRTGIYSPEAGSRAEVVELERHDCPELFVLLGGRVTLVVADGPEPRDIELLPGRPVLVRAPHSAYCPDGAHTGTAFVVERDSFDTEYRELSAWTQDSAS